MMKAGKREEQEEARDERGEFHRAPLRLRLDSTLLGSQLRTRKMNRANAAANPRQSSMSSSPAVNTILRPRPLRCARILASRQSSHGDLPRRTSDRKLKGRKSTAYERASASFLLEIDRLRPHFGLFPFQLFDCLIV